MSISRALCIFMIRNRLISWPVLLPQAICLTRKAGRFVVCPSFAAPVSWSLDCGSLMLSVLISKGRQSSSLYRAQHRPYPLLSMYVCRLISFTLLRPHMVQIYEIKLTSLAAEPSSTVHSFHLLKAIPLPLYKVIRSIDPERKLVALSTSGLVEILSWDECQGGSSEDHLNSQTITLNTDDQEGLVCTRCLAKFPMT